MLETFFEQNLKTHTNTHDRLACHQAFVDQFIHVEGVECLHNGGKSADAGNEQPIGVENLIAITCERNISSGGLESTNGRVNVTNPVIKNYNGGFGHRAPLVEGMPFTRGSASTALRMALANALNSVSAMW
ncbi:unannotated protein [freshwater metagenome]|uniref:Unannotated protein n=1 Tax=freshwater metagenome TaxID=449393 RepID=A0A6J6GQF0_9ZZZZ